jgi:predicted TIM-barrel fold metal-dependent hydrolase
VLRRERKPAYSVPNDRVIAWAEASAGRLVPFCRLDPAEGPLEEAERCLAAGARGIKLHPRAQDFVFDGPEMDGVFALAESARVPILIHAGRAGARGPCPAPSRGRPDPRARRDL